jgi:hypothetical protein
MAAAHAVPLLDPRGRESTPPAPKREAKATRGKARQGKARQKQRREDNIIRRKGRVGSDESRTARCRVIHALSFSSLLSTSLYKQLVERSRVRVAH